jgi:transposase
MTERVLAVGIDPAKRAHHAVAVLYPDRVILDMPVANTIEAIEALDDRLTALARTQGAELLYGLEDHRGSGSMVVRVLGARRRTVRVVNPLWTHRQKDFYGQDKTDSVDARAIAAVVLRRADTLSSAVDDSDLTIAIRQAEQTLEDLGRQRTRNLNRLHQRLTETYLPAYETFFRHLRYPWALRFFARYPTAHDLEGVSAEQLAEELWELAGRRLFGCRLADRAAMLRARAAHILQASAALRRLPPTPALAMQRELVRQLCEDLLANLDHAQRLDRLLKIELLPASGQHLQTVPGIGIRMAAAIVGEVGDVHRFASRDAFAKYNGTAPASKSSGGRERHVARRSCNHRLKRALWLAACAAVRHDRLARAHYNACVARGLSGIDAIKRVARRMSDLIYAMMLRRTRYDRSVVERSIACRAGAAVST